MHDIKSYVSINPLPNKPYFLCVCGTGLFNPLPNDKFLDLTKLKEFTDDKFKVAEMRISLFDRVENKGGKGKYAGYQHFHLFPKCFPKSSLGSLKVGIVR